MPRKLTKLGKLRKELREAYTANESMAAKLTYTIGVCEAAKHAHAAIQERLKTQLAEARRRTMSFPNQYHEINFLPIAVEKCEIKVDVHTVGSVTGHTMQIPGAKRCVLTILCDMFDNPPTVTTYEEKMAS